MFSGKLITSNPSIGADEKVLFQDKRVTVSTEELQSVLKRLDEILIRLDRLEKAFDEYARRMSGPLETLREKCPVISDRPMEEPPHA